MKKKIAILGSTGSIGRSLLNIIDKEKNSFDIVLLSANRSSKKLLKQAIKFKVKNIIINDHKQYKILKKRNIYKKNIKIFNNFESFNQIFKKKIDYVMSSIIGLDGLKPTIDIIKYTKRIAIANKESIICGWNFIKEELKKNKTEFIPVDSEHFSIWYGLKNKNKNQIDKIFLTASGGPLYNIAINKFNKIKISQVLKHPNWKMGKKISIDSATMINKVYEVIEAKNIFDISYKKIKILIHPKSYVHSLLKFNDGMIQIIAHDTNMKIPIFNTLFFNTNRQIKSKKIDFKVLNDLNFNEIDFKRFPMVKILDLLPNKHSLFETVIVSSNDTLVELFLKQKINFTDIQKKLFSFLRMKEFIKYKKTYPRNIKDIIDLNNYVRLKILKKVYKIAND